MEPPVFEDMGVVPQTPANVIVYTAGGAIELVDLYECPASLLLDDDDNGRGAADGEVDVQHYAPLPIPALRHCVSGRLFRPWPDHRIGFEVHFAISPPIDNSEEDALVNALWYNYRTNAETGLMARLNQLGQEDEEARNLVDQMRTEYIAPKKKARFVQRPHNFIGRIESGAAAARQLEKHSGLDNVSIHVAHVESPHVALWLMGRCNSTWSMGVWANNIRSERRLTLLLPMSATLYTVMQPNVARFGAQWPLLTAMIWDQLPQWHQGIAITLGGHGALLDDFLSDEVHVLPPHIPAHQPLVIDGRAQPKEPPKLLFGDYEFPRAAVVDSKATTNKKTKTNKAPNFSAAPKSKFRGVEFIEGARRAYAPVKKRGHVLRGPLALEPLLSMQQYMAARDDRQDKRKPATKRKRAGDNMPAANSVLDTWLVGKRARTE